MAKNKIIRILVMEGDPMWMRRTLQQSHIHPESPLDTGSFKITEIQRIYPHQVRNMEIFLKRLQGYITPILAAERLALKGGETEDDRKFTSES